MLMISNTLTGKKEQFVPLQEGIVLMYVCGITPYDRAHLGHGRCYVSFDLLYRLFVLLGYDVQYIRNFTDIDDKLINRAQQELGDKHRYKGIAARFIESYHQDMTALNCVNPTREPCVTDHIPEIILFVEKLIASGYAYVVDGDVYFEVRRAAGYGKLSKRNLDELCVGARVEINTKKRDPLDFALWKGEPSGEFFKSPWGYGRPGWHIECSALAARYLGHKIDVHAGGLDLIFPHHENEIAQSESLYQVQFARYWLHNGFVTINKEKMSKSLGNFFTLDDIFKMVNPMVLRFYYLTHHFRAPIEFSIDTVLSLQKTYQKLVQAFGATPDVSFSYAQLVSYSVIRPMLEFLCDDLNSQGMIGYIFEHLHELSTHEIHAQATAWLLRHVLGLSLESITHAEVTITPEIQQLIDQREKARIAKDWKAADALRSQLEGLGVQVQDKKAT